MEKVNWKVEGMSCTNCALTIHKYLEGKGVENVKVNFMGGDVSFDINGNVTAPEIEKGIEASGKAYQDAINKLNTGSGNLIRRIENIKKLGAKTNKEKQIPSKFLDNDATSQLFMEGPES